MKAAKSNELGLKMKWITHCYIARDVDNMKQPFGFSLWWSLRFPANINNYNIPIEIIITVTVGHYFYKSQSFRYYSFCTKYLSFLSRFPFHLYCMIEMEYIMHKLWSLAGILWILNRILIADVQILINFIIMQWDDGIYDFSLSTQMIENNRKLLNTNGEEER